MAAAEGVEGAAPAGAEVEKKGSGKKLVLIGVLALAAAAAGAYFAGLLPIGGAAPAPEAAEENAPPEIPKVAAPGAIYAFDPFVANLADRPGVRYLKLKIEVEFLSPEVPEGLEARIPQIRDLLLTLLTSKTFDEIRTPEGKQELREEIIDRINQVLEQDLVRAVYFTDFIVQ